MSLARKVAQNTIIQFIGKALGTIIALVAVRIMLHYLGPRGMGEYTTAISFLSIFAVLIDMGLYLVITREISKEGADENKYIGNAVAIRLVFGGLVLGLAPLIVLLFPYSEETKLAVLIGTVSFLAISLNQILVGVFQKNLRMDKVAIGEVIGRLVWLAGVWLVAYFDWGLLVMVGFLSISSVVNFGLVWIFSRKYLKVSLKFDLRTWKKILRMAAPLALSVIFNLVYFRAGVIFLSIFKSPEEVGIFGAAQKVLENLVTFSAIFAGLLFPVLSRYVAAKRMDKFANVFRRGFDVLAMLVVPLVIGTSMLAGPIVIFFGGQEFAQSAQVLQGLIWAVGAIFFANLFGNVVVAIEQQKKIAYVYGSAAVVAIGMGLWVIPQYSYFGAMAMTIVTEVMVFLGMGIIAVRETGVRPHLAVTGKALLASGLMAMAIYLTQDINFWLALGLAVLVYFGVLYILKGFSWPMIKEIISLRRD